MHEIVPAAVGTRLLAFEAGDVEPVTRARHGDVEQPVALLGFEGCAHLACPGDRGVACRALDAPHKRRRLDAFRKLDARQVEHRGRAAGCGRAGIGKEDDRRLEPLGAVHGHHPHLVAAMLHVALHLGVGLAQVGEEAGQRRRRAVVVGEREVEELIERVGSLGSEAGKELRARALAIEDRGEELERRRVVGARAPALQRVCSALVERF